MTNKIEGIGSPAHGELVARTQKQNNNPSTSIVPGKATDGLSFASVMSNMATDAMNDLKKAEDLSIKGIKGTANTREVVDATLEAERSLQTAVALRDKITSAFFDIAKMQM
jgi:flagellar hook-basal body complex protein FliE